MSTRSALTGIEKVMVVVFTTGDIFSDGADGWLQELHELLNLELSFSSTRRPGTLRTARAVWWKAVGGKQRAGSVRCL